MTTEDTRRCSSTWSTVRLLPKINITFHYITAANCFLRGLTTHDVYTDLYRFFFLILTSRSEYDLLFSCIASFSAYSGLCTSKRRCWCVVVVVVVITSLIFPDWPKLCSLFPSSDSFKDRCECPCIISRDHSLVIQAFLAMSQSI